MRSFRMFIRVINRWNFNKKIEYADGDCGGYDINKNSICKGANVINEAETIGESKNIPD